MNERPQDAKTRLARRRFTLIAAAIAAGAAAGVALIYGIGGPQSNANAECKPALDAAQRAAAFARGEVAAVNVAKSGLKLPDVSFRDASGKSLTLSSFHGRTVLLNLWATWCVPCRKEMPALDSLEQRLGGPNFQVVAVNIDTRDLDKPKSWLKEVGVERLAYYADPSAKIFQDLKAIGRAFGMPTTILIDGNGCEIGTIAGPAEWASDDALKLIEAAAKR
jgi:thiol-disulfide isomerase/thioredoxin